MRTLVFIIGIHCTLHASAEHRKLQSIGFNSQFHYVFQDGVHQIVYTEDLGTKTNKGGLKHRKLKGKEVTIYANMENKAHCPVWVFFKYHAQLPIQGTCSALYLRPKPNYTDGAWFCDAFMGINKIRNVVKDITGKVGMKGFFTNHSLRSTAAMHLY